MDNDYIQYPTEYIQDFLGQKGIIWDGEYDTLHSLPDKLIAHANVELRKKQGNVDGSIGLTISDTSFICIVTEPITRNSDKSIAKDFSKEWLKFLLAKEPQRAYKIRKLLENNINTMHTDSAKQIEKLKAQIQEVKKSEKLLCQEWNQLLDIANKSINQTTAPTDEERSL